MGIGQDIYWMHLCRNLLIFSIFNQLQLQANICQQEVLNHFYKKNIIFFHPKLQQCYTMIKYLFLLHLLQKYQSQLIHQHIFYHLCLVNKQVNRQGQEQQYYMGHHIICILQQHYQYTRIKCSALKKDCQLLNCSIHNEHQLFQQIKYKFYMVLLGLLRSFQLNQNLKHKKHLLKHHLYHLNQLAIYKLQLY